MGTVYRASVPFGIPLGVVGDRRKVSGLAGSLAEGFAGRRRTFCCCPLSLGKAADACAIRPLKVSEWPPRGLAGLVSQNFWDRYPKVVLCLASLLVACQDYPGLQFRAERARGSPEFPSKSFQPVSVR